MNLDVPNPIQESAGRPLLLPLGAGLLAATVGAIAWALVVESADYELGILAWGIGFAAGTAVVLGAGGARGRLLQVIAVTCALFGVLLGKYLAYALIVQDAVAEQGIEASLFESAMLESFRLDLGHVFTGFDALWIGLAAWSAWRLPRAGGEPMPAD